MECHRDSIDRKGQIDCLTPYPQIAIGRAFRHFATSARRISRTSPQSDDERHIIFVTIPSSEEEGSSEKRTTISE
jgi:hypothetical protein